MDHHCLPATPRPDLRALRHRRPAICKLAGLGLDTKLDAVAAFCRNYGRRPVRRHAVRRRNNGQVSKRRQVPVALHFHCALRDCTWRRPRVRILPESIIFDFQRTVLRPLLDTISRGPFFGHIRLISRRLACARAQSRYPEAMPERIWATGLPRYWLCLSLFSPTPARILLP